MASDVIPLKVRVSDGSVAPEPLVTKRTAATREEILTGLTERERMLIFALVTSLELIEDWVGGQAARESAKPLLQAFQDATGVDYVGCAWDA